MEESKDGALEVLRAKFLQEYTFDIRQANKSVIQGTGSPDAVGARLFNNGIRYGCVLRDLSIVEPFFAGANLAFEEAQRRQTTVRRSPVYDALFNCFTLNFGLCCAPAITSRQEMPRDTASFCLALAALYSSFTRPVLRSAQDSPEEFRTVEFSSLVLTTLSLTLVARFWKVEISESVVREVVMLPISPLYEGVRGSLVAIWSEGADSRAIAQLRSSYRSIVNPTTYKTGLIGNLRFIDAYAIALCKEQGQVTRALLHMLT